MNKIIAIVIMLLVVVIVMHMVQEDKNNYTVSNNVLTMREFLLERDIVMKSDDPKANNVYKKITVRKGDPPKNWEKYPNDVSARFTTNAKEPDDVKYFLFLFPGSNPKQ